jgi:NADH-quinone oxidoreductase subunit L
VFLAFHGPRHAGGHAAAHPEEEEPASRGHAPAHAKAAHAAAGHHLHDAPPSMAIPLIVLAIGSIGAGYIGVPHALGGSNHIEHFLEPSFEVAGSARHAQVTGAATTSLDLGAVRPASVQDAPAAGEAAGAEDHGDTELMLMGLSVGVAFAGIGIAAYFWLRNRAAADRLSRSMSGLYQLLANKYYVDELYDAAIVQPIKLFSTGGLWKGMDAGVVDGAVNGVGLTVQAGSGGLRRVQTGSVRTYAAALILGVVVILGFYLWR